MPSLQISANATAFSAVLVVIVARLAAAITDRKIKIVAVPDNRLHEYTAEQAILVRVNPPEPIPENGAGRYGKYTKRNVDCVILTQSLLDAAGQDPVAVAAHLDAEEAVVNALEQQAPVGTPYNLRTGIQIRWVPGGDAITRQIGRGGDTGMMLSTIVFRVEYQTPCLVIRD